MKLRYAIAIGAFGCVSLAATAQQQSPFGTPALTAQPTAGGPIVLNLTGVTVTDAAGQPVGPIQNILLSPSGCVDMAVLSLGGQKLVPVPWTLVSGAGAARGQNEVAGGATLALKVDRTVLQQAPTVTTAQLSQPQTMVQVRQYFSQYQQQQQGGTGSQTNINTGVGGSTTNQGLTNAATGNTNQTGILSPTGPTNSAPGRPAYDTNRPGRRVGPPDGRPPYGRPSTNTPPSVPGPGAGVPGTGTPNNSSELQ
jgi:hypothetical protein